MRKILWGRSLLNLPRGLVLKIEKRNCSHYSIKEGFCSNLITDGSPCISSLWIETFISGWTWYQYSDGEQMKKYGSFLCSPFSPKFMGVIESQFLVNQTLVSPATAAALSFIYYAIFPVHVILAWHFPRHSGDFRIIKASEASCGCRGRSLGRDGPDGESARTT